MRIQNNEMIIKRCNFAHYFPKEFLGLSLFFTMTPCILTYRSGDRHALQNFADQIRICRDTLEALGHLNEINNQTSLVKVVEKLPTYLQNKWKHKAHTVHKTQFRLPDINDVVCFIEDAAEEENDTPCVWKSYR